MRSIRGRSGRLFLVRPLRRDDHVRLGEAYGRLSPDSKYKRFLAIKPVLSATDVRHLVDVDARNHVALALTPADEPQRIVGVARFVRAHDDPTLAEFSIVLGDDFQREGIGRTLLRMLAQDAVALGVERFTALVLAENVGAHRLIEGLSPVPARWERHGPTDEAEIELIPAFARAA